MSQGVRQMIANKVKQQRLLLNLTSEELSLKLGLDNSYVSKLENCRINITIDNLEKIATFFKVPIKDFFTNDKMD